LIHKPEPRSYSSYVGGGWEVGYGGQHLTGWTEALWSDGESGKINVVLCEVEFLSQLGVWELLFFSGSRMML